MGKVKLVIIMVRHYWSEPRYKLAAECEWQYKLKLK